MHNSEKSDAAAIVEAVRETGKPFSLNGVPAVLVPAGAEVETFPDLRAKLEARPQLLAQTVILEDADSFISYVNRFADTATTVFANTDEGSFSAVLDYHEAADAPRHGSHIASYVCPKTPEWSAWRQQSGKQMTQEEFALFLEQNLSEIREPAAAQMLEVALTLKSKKNIDFSRGTRLDNGQTQLVYVEQMDNRAGKSGELTIPDEIVLGLQPFRGSAVYEQRAKFRYRIKESSLVMWYDLTRPHRVIESAFSDVREKIRGGLTTGMLINGKI